MWMIELTTKTMTAASRIGSHKLRMPVMKRSCWIVVLCCARDRAISLSFYVDPEHRRIGGRVFQIQLLQRIGNCPRYEQVANVLVVGRNDVPRRRFGVGLTEHAFVSLG